MSRSPSARSSRWALPHLLWSNQAAISGQIEPPQHLTAAESTSPMRIARIIGIAHGQQGLLFELTLFWKRATTFNIQIFLMLEPRKSVAPQLFQFSVTPSISRSSSTQEHRTFKNTTSPPPEIANKIARFNVNKGFEQRVMLNEMFHDIGRPEQFDPPHSAKAQRFFQLIRQKGQVENSMMVELNRIRYSESRYKMLSKTEKKKPDEATLRQQQERQMMASMAKQRQELQRKRIFEDLDSKFEENLSILQNHAKFKEFFDLLDEDLKKSVDINYMMLASRTQDVLDELVSKEIKLLLFNTLEKIDEQHIIPIFNPQVENFGMLKHKYKQVASDIMMQMGPCVSNLMAIFTKTDPQIATICEGMWKVILFMYNLLIEFVEDEKARFEKKTLTSMQDELQRSQHIITRLNEQLYALREESSKKEKQDLYRLQMLENQLAHVKSEFQEFRLQQQELGSLEHATGCMKHIEMSLKDTKDAIFKMQDGIDDRDMVLRGALKTVVNAYKEQKSAGQSLTQRFESLFGLDRIAPNLMAVLTQTSFRHPFMPLLIHSQFQQAPCEQVYRIKDSLKFLVDWFHSEAQKTHQRDSNLETILAHLRNVQGEDREHPATRFLEYLGLQIHDVVPRDDNHNRVVSVALQDVLSDLNDWSLRSEDLERFTRGEALEFNTARFFSQVLGVNKHPCMGPYAFCAFLAMFQACVIGNPKLDDSEQASPQSPQHTNKFRWLTKIITDLPMIISQVLVVPEQSITQYLDGRSTLADIFTKLADLNLNKKQDMITLVLREFKSYPGNYLSQQTAIKGLSQQLSKLNQGSDLFEIELLLFENYNKFLKFTQRDQPKRRLTTTQQFLGQLAWEEYVKDCCELIKDVSRMFPRRILLKVEHEEPVVNQYEDELLDSPPSQLTEPQTQFKKLVKRVLKTK